MITLDRVLKKTPLLRAQYTLLTSEAWIKTAVGGYGSGKTDGAALTFLRNVLRNPYDKEAYGEDRPESIVCGPTHSVLKESSMKALRALLPPELILKEWVQDRRWRIAGGHDILFRSVEGAIEGANLCTLWLDEAHLLDAADWPNLQMRVRDAKAANLLVLVSGLPEFGWLQDAFGRPEHYQDPQRCVVHFSTLDNHYLAPKVLEQLRSSVGEADAEAYLHGKWRSAENAVFYAYEPAIHVIDLPVDRRIPVHITCDVGNRGAVLILQPRTRRYRTTNGSTVEGLHLHVVDELLPENVSTEEAMRLAQQRGWKIEPGVSMVFMDPRSNVDQIEAVRRVLGRDARIIRKTRGQPGYDVDEGHRAVNAALKDSLGNVRLTFASTLPRDKRSLLTSLPKVRRKPDGDGMVKDNITDHVADALRYPVVHLMPLRSGKIEVTHVQG